MSCMGVDATDFMSTSISDLLPKSDHVMGALSPNEPVSMLLELAHTSRTKRDSLGVFAWMRAVGLSVANGAAAGMWALLRAAKVRSRRARICKVQNFGNR